MRIGELCRQRIQRISASQTPLAKRERSQFINANQTAIRAEPRIAESIFDILPAEAGKPLWERVGSKIVCRFHGGQLEAWGSGAQVVAIIAGTQSGKTSYGPLWFLREIARAGPGDYIVVTPSYKLLRLKCLPELLRLFGRTLKLGKWKASEQQFVFSPRGSQLVFGDASAECTIFFGHADNPDSLESATAKGAWLDECGQSRFKLGSFEALQRRLAIHDGRMLLTTTPYNLGWLKTQVYDKWKAGDSHFHVVRFDSTANPAFPVVVFERARASLPKWKFDLFYRGIFSVPAGLIYDVAFDDEGNCRVAVPRFQIPDEWPRYAGIDFGPINTAAVMAAAEMKDGRRTGIVYLYRSYWPRKTLESKQHVAAIRAGEPQKIDATGGAKTTEQGWRDAFTTAGLKVSEPSIKDVEPGIDCVYGAFARAQLLIFDDLVDVLDDIGGYTREVEDDGAVSEDIADKAKFHLCDAIRYLAIKLWPPKASWTKRLHEIKL